MTRTQLDSLLRSNGIYHSGNLLDRLMKEFNKLNDIEEILNELDDIEKEENRIGSQYGIEQARLTALNDIREVLKGE